MYKDAFQNWIYDEGVLTFSGQKGYCLFNWNGTNISNID